MMRLHAPSSVRALAGASVLSVLALAGAPASAQTLPQGVATGDVTQRTGVLWARSTVPGDVVFEWSRDASFGTVDGRGVVTVADVLQPAKLAISGLSSSTVYHVRATNAAGESAQATFRTADVRGLRDGMRFGMTGDWREAPPYPALRNVDDFPLEFFIKLGDNIYADIETPGQPGLRQARTLEQFRLKHLEIITGREPVEDVNTMTDLARVMPLIAIIDDHELVNNFAGGAAPADSPDADDSNKGEPPLFTEDVPYVNQTAAYATAIRAYNEYHPVREETWNTPQDDRLHERPRLYRAVRHGDDGFVSIVDARSFRDAPLEPANLADQNDIVRFIVQSFNPARTMLGRPQLAQLQQDLLAAEADGVIWKFIVVPQPVQNFGVLAAEDRFEGFAAERNTLLAFIEGAGIRNVVFLAGDFHGSIVNNLTYQAGPFQPQIATGAIEIATGPAAFYDGLFGPTVARLALAAGLISPQEYAFYLSLPVAPDPDSIPNDKDDFVKALLKAQTSALGYDGPGLNDNLPQTEGRFSATLLAGDYVSVHNYTWADIEVEPGTHRLVTTVWGVEAYSEDDFQADPERIAGLVPTIVAKFVLNPTGGTVCSSDFNGDGAVDSDDFFDFLNAYYAGAAGADFNRDGSVDSDDFFDFLNAYLAPC